MWRWSLPFPTRPSWRAGDPAAPFSGIVYVEDWRGKLIRSFTYSDGNVRIYEPGEEESAGGRMAICTRYVDWYTCSSSNGGGSWSCHYSYTEEILYTCDDGQSATGNCNICYVYGPGAGSGPNTGSGGGSGGTGSNNDPPVLCDEGYVSDGKGGCTLNIEEELAGDKPIKEYASKCNGVLDMWNSYPNNEVAGYLTSDGKLILTNVVGSSGGETFGTYFYNGTYYYPYPKSQGSPNQSYSGILEVGPFNNRYYLIPVVASLHTHTPCRTDGTDGITNFAVSTEDSARAANAAGLNHWVIGCGAIGQFNSVSNSYFNISTGNLSVLCSQLE